MIDGYCQPGSSANTATVGDNATLMIELDGSEDTASDATGISIITPGCTVEGLDINQFNTYGIDASGAVIEGNFIGTDPTGTIAEPNAFGVKIDSSRVGVCGADSDPLAERNVISGNSLRGVDVGSNCTVAGNYIGTDATGETALGNGLGPFTYGVYVSGVNNTIGANGDVNGDAYEGNLISGNAIDGGAAGYSAGLAVGPDAAGTVVAGNLIGTDATGTKALPNAVGVDLSAGRVGACGSDPVPSAERNIISGNLYAGVWVFGTGCVIAGNFIGTDVTGEAALEQWHRC